MNEVNHELETLRAEHRQIAGLLSVIQELTSRAVRSESIAELFCRALSTLFRCVRFDAGLTVMLEQNLDLYVTTREGSEALVNEALIDKIRATLEETIPVSFATTEVVVKSELHDLPRSDVSTGIDYEAAAVIEQEHRTAGLLALYRRDGDFSDGERRVLSVFATQVSMLLDTIHAREQIAMLADTDDLTGIWNRRYFRRQLPQEIERARTFKVPLTLMLFDIDEFKQINDSFGHVVGDVVLSELCGAVRETLRPTDTLARFGGDEFAVILPHTDAEGAKAVADRVLNRVRALTVPADDDGVIQCSLSIGIAELEPNDTSANEFLHRADTRLYEAKRQGKNRYTA